MKSSPLRKRIQNELPHKKAENRYDSQEIKNGDQIEAFDLNLNRDNENMLVQISPD